jgi:hypothetical protein
MVKTFQVSIYAALNEYFIRLNPPKSTKKSSNLAARWTFSVTAILANCAII